MKDYSAYLTFDRIDESEISAIQTIARQFSQVIDIGENHLEYDYIGRDTGRRIIHLFAQIAPILGNCEGEICCEIENNDGNNLYEFFFIRDRTLFCQSGKIVRGTVEKVSLPMD